MSSYICLASHKDLIKILHAACAQLCHTWAASTILLFAYFCKSPHGRQCLPFLHAPFQSLLGSDEVYLQPFFLTADGQQAAEKAILINGEGFLAKKAESLVSGGKMKLSAVDSDSKLERTEERGALSRAVGLRQQGPGSNGQLGRADPGQM